MADNNVLINVSAVTDKAVQALNKISNSMVKISKDIDKTSAKMYNFSHTMQEVGQNIYSVGQRATIGISAPLAGISKSLIDTGASMKALNSTFSVVFKDTEKSARAWSKKFGQRVGLSAGIIDEAQLEFAKMGGSFGFTGKQLNDFSQKWTEMTVKMSAFTDVPIAEAIDMVKSGLRGETDSIENLGLFFSDTNKKAMMLNMGLKGQYSELDNTTQMAVLYALATKQSAMANGQAEREANSYQNKLANLKQAYKEFAEVFFLAVEPAVLDFLENLTRMANKLKELTPEQLKFTATFVKWAIIIPPVVMYLGAFIENLGRLGKVTSYLMKLNMAKMFLGIKSSIETLYIRSMFVGDGLKLVASGVTKVYGAVASSLGTIVPMIGISVGWLIVIIAGIATAVYFVIKYWDEIKAFTIKTWGIIVNFMKQVWAQVLAVLILAKNRIAPVVMAITKVMTEIFTKHILPVYNQYIKPIVTLIVSVVQAIWYSLKFLAGIIASVVLVIGAVIVGLGKVIWVAIKFIVDVFKVLWQIIVFVVNIILVTFSALITAIIAIVGFISPIIGVIAKLIWWIVSGVLAPVIQFIAKLFYFIAKEVLKFFWERAKEVFQGVGDKLRVLGDIFMWVIEKIINPILKWLVAGLQGLATIWTAIVHVLKDKWLSFGNSLISGYNKYIKPAFDFIVDALMNLNNNWSKVWEGMKKTFVNIVNSIKKAWKGVMDSFKLPHFSVSGDFSMNPPSAPKFKVDWYERGGIFSSASVVGIGENGDEAVVPLSNKKRVAPFASAVASQFKDLLPDSMGSDESASGDVVINVSSLVVREEADVNKIAKELYRLQEKNRRSRGVFGSV